MYITPVGAIVLDLLAQFLLQLGYVVQKMGHQSVERFNEN